MGKVIVVAVCVLLTGLLAAIEMALVTLSIPHLKQLSKNGDTRAAKLLRYRENPERTLSILQLGIALVGGISAAVGGVGAHENIGPLLQQHFGWNGPWVGPLAIAMVVLPLTFVTAVIGELVPKTLALRSPMKVAGVGITTLSILETIFAPIISTLELSTRLILKFIKLGIEDKSTASLDINRLSEHHQMYVINIFDLEKKRVKDIMLPWAQVDTVHVDWTMPQVYQKLLSSGHTRLPVQDDQNVLGVLHAKEFMAFREAGATDWRSIMRPILKLRESDLLIKSLRLMQSSRRHMSLVISPEEVLVGIVTLEDIIEEIVGEIYDEDDDGAVRRILAASAALKMRGW